MIAGDICLRKWTLIGVIAYVTDLIRTLMHTECLCFLCGISSMKCVSAYVIITVWSFSLSLLYLVDRRIIHQGRLTDVSDTKITIVFHIHDSILKYQGWQNVYILAKKTLRMAMIIDGDNDNIYMIVNSVWCICGFGVIGILIGDIICYSA